MLRAAFVLVLGVLASGCVGSSPPPPPAPAEYPYAISLVNGTGYEYTVLLTNTTAFVSADFAADGSAFAACQDDGYVHAWWRNRTLISAWPGHPYAGRGCTVRFLDNESIVISDYRTLRAFALNGSELWSFTVSTTYQSIARFELGRGGSLVLLSYGGPYQNASVRLWDRQLNTTVEFPVSAGADPLAVDPPYIALAEGGAVLAISSGDIHGGVTRFYRTTGDPLMEIPRRSGVGLSADGRFGMVGMSADETQRDFVIVDLTTSPATARNVTANFTTSTLSFFPTPGRFFVSPTGSFFAFETGQQTSHCPSAFSCNSTYESFTRVLRAANVTQDLGFGPGDPLTVEMRDDGSAVAIAYTRLDLRDPYLSRPANVVLITAQPGATPPLQNRTN